MRFLEKNENIRGLKVLPVPMREASVMEHPDISMQLCKPDPTITWSGVRLGQRFGEIGLTEMTNLKGNWKVCWGGDLNSERLGENQKYEPVPDCCCRLLLVFTLGKWDVPIFNFLNYARR